MSVVEQPRSERKTQTRALKQAMTQELQISILQNKEK